MSQELVDDLQKQIPAFISQNLKAWIESTVLRAAMSYARAANMPKAFIDGIHLEQHENGYALVNNWQNDEGAPLAVFFELGTVDHWIQPKDPKGVLAWPAVSGKHGSAIYYQSGVAPGTMLYSKGHYVTGLARHEPMHRGLEKGQKQLTRKIKKELRKKFSSETEGYKVRLTF